MANDGDSNQVQRIEALVARATAELAASGTSEAIDAWKSAYLGNSGELKTMLGGLRDVAKQGRPAFGAALNTARTTLEAAMAERKAALGAGTTVDVSERIDVTEPGTMMTQTLGKRHVLSRVRAELVDVFARMGFEVAEGPELEDDDHNFVKLNIPHGHPARDPADNFYVDDPAKVAQPRMLRSQTSTVQVRVMEEAVRRGGGNFAGPIRIVSPGRVYRPDTVDATHSFMFHQIEGLAVDRNLSMADLKSVLFQFTRAYFGEGAQIRFTPTFYPFTEPSAQFEILVRLTPDAEPRWIELGGCGMVDPAVFEACGVDPEAWTGFAFGFGVERLAMGKYKIPDIRLLYTNDLRFLASV